MRNWTVSKGHGTENDFVIVMDRHGLLNPTAQDVRDLCNRRTGVGGDGLLRVVPAAHVPEWDGDPELWFMDYRNADGSVSEMCGNGVRVFARYLADEGLVNSPEIPVATRAGIKTVTQQPHGQYRVDMGVVVVDKNPTVIQLGERTLEATPVDVGNPHAVCFVESVAELDLTKQPGFSPERFPEGVNIEFIEVVESGHVRMRVFERGVGETRSCGTGTVAGAAAAQVTLGGDRWQVDVPGGILQIELGNTAYMTGPAVIVAHAEVILPEED